ncbi:hypothetical protein RUESEDTHA_02625 [Ruegeria sp. THAF57]|uniref:hypothetical protein n=1 Tax=Ruegeria sp. THAF57 TaxID=2744555 RepID=UPI0015DF9873|nr:hypothetical protein [Ruegeria sp. THAF57]CAD0185729.1 hypothetical protein RUESEDTHA_02625 [Ruegeria sp. THAF57]
MRDALYSGRLAVFGAGGMPSWRYPSLVSLIAGGGVDLSPLASRQNSLSLASEELAAVDHPTPLGVAVVADYLH